MKQFLKIFNKVGGKELLRQYRKAHVLFFSFFITLVLGFKKKSLEIVRLAVNNKVLNKLRKKYKPFITEYKKNAADDSEKVRSNKVWFLWLQGLDSAPELVKKCYRSLVDNLNDKDIILLTEDNYKDYVSFPEYIQKKIDDGTITRTHMSDLLRLELLINHGGTWIDATVYCSGNDYPEYIFDSDLFTFQCLKPGLDGHCNAISSWLMTGCTNNPILMLTRALLYEYWKTHNRLVDYFLVHDFFQLSIEAYPEEWNKVVPFCNSTPHILLLRLFEQYDERMWEAIKEQTCFHKITYKFSESDASRSGTYYDVIFKGSCD